MFWDKLYIGFGEYSKSRKTVYFNDQAFQSCKGRGVGANFYDLESQDEYWISGIKREGGDRHWAGGGKINIEEKIIEEYLTLVDFDEIDKLTFEIVNIPKTDKTKFEQIENKQMESAIKRKRKKNMKTEE